jgi:hypothetical protein
METITFCMDVYFLKYALKIDNPSANQSKKDILKWNDEQPQKGKQKRKKKYLKSLNTKNTLTSDIQVLSTDRNWDKIYSP